MQPNPQNKNHLDLGRGSEPKARLLTPDWIHQKYRRSRRNRLYFYGSSDERELPKENAPKRKDKP